MKITWLGQAGLLFQTADMTILIDPYLSDNVKNYEPQNARRVPVEEAFLHIKPDVILITHNHLDHLDPETLKYYLTPDYDGLLLAPNGSWQELRKTFPCRGNTVLFNPGTVWTQGAVCFRAVKAEHSDPNAIGVILSSEGKNYYVTGDTLCNEQVFSSLPALPIYALFLPVNGKGNNMNFADAAAFSARVHPRYTVPIHIGMFDSLTAKNWQIPNKIQPSVFREISFPADGE